MNNPRLFLKKNEEDQIKNGFPWVFDNEIAFVKAMIGEKIEQVAFESCKIPDGTFVEVYTKGGQILGCGILNKKSKIAVRLLERKIISEGRDAFSVDYFVQKIQQAQAIRAAFYPASDSYRLIFAEADLLPGLIVERYCTVENTLFLTVQFLTLGAEVFKSEILDALRLVCNPTGIFERSDVPVRKLEGLSECCGWLGKEFDPLIVIEENGVRLSIDLQKGQKTGYFLDQKKNRKTVQMLSGGKRVLDTFAHTGSFALNAVLGGAKEVIAVDISSDAVQMIEHNVQQNKAEQKVTTICADVFELLRQYEQDKEKFDLIILDPPAFTKNAQNIDRAYGGYKEINYRAMKILNPGGILISCSCSNFFDANLFYDMLMHSAKDAKRTVQILEKSGAGYDHPILIGYPRSEYLTCALMRIL